MAYVWGILAFIFFILSLGMFIGIFNPKLINKRLKENQKPFTRKKAAAFWIAFGIIFSIFLVLANPTPDKGTLASPTNAPASSPKALQNNSTTAAPIIKATTVATIKSTPKPTSTPIPTLDPSIKKAADAKTAYDKFDAVIKEYSDVLNSLNKTINDSANGTTDQVTTYDLLGTLKDKALDVFSQAEAMNVPKQYSQSRDNLSGGAASLQDGISELRKYLDAPKVSTLSTVKDDLKTANDVLQLTTISVVTQAMSDGYVLPSPSPK